MTKKALLIIFGGFVVAAIVAIISFLPSSGSLRPGQKLKIVAAENFWGDIAAQIGGDHVTVTSLISDPSADPHLYESGAKDASSLANADVVIVNGLGYDDFASKLLQAAPSHHRVVITAADVLSAKNGDNPHLWYDISRVGLMASDIMRVLAGKDPANQAAYQSNLDTFLDSMRPVIDTMIAIHAAYPQAPVGYTERVPAYLLNDADLSVVSPSGFATAIEEGNEPSPADQAAMLSLITHKQIRALLYNAQADSPAATSIKEAAIKNNIPVIAVTETIPNGVATYQAWQKAQIDALKAALDQTK